MALNETIRPSCIIPGESLAKARILCYSSSWKRCLIISGSTSLLLVNIDSQESVTQLAVPERLMLGHRVALCSDSSSLAISSTPYMDNPSLISVLQLPKSSTKLDRRVTATHSFCIRPDFGDDYISCLKFFPSGKKIVAAVVPDMPLKEDKISGRWCRVIHLPEIIWNGSETAEDFEDEKTLEYADINAIEQGFTIPEDRKETLAKENDEDYISHYSTMCDVSYPGGFHCLAISPDTTRILTGNNDGEVFIFDSHSLKLVQRIRAYEYYIGVISCHYNPVFGRNEFATCGDSGLLYIWRVDGSENACVVHQLTLTPRSEEDSTYSNGASYCSYSPDGKLIAVTCESEKVKTYIIGSNSGKILYTLLYMDKPMTYRGLIYPACHNLFFGNLCEVAAISQDNPLCVWKLPVVYSLETLSLLIIKESVRYNNVD